MRPPWPEAILFDLDGTLFRTETLSLPAYHATFDRLRAEGLWQGATPPEERFLGSLGMLLPEIWRRVLGDDASPQLVQRADALLLEQQLQKLREGFGVLYPGVAETLAALADRGIRLFVASNGLEAYVKEVIRHKGVARLFTGLYSAGEYRTRSKVELVRLILDQHGIRRAWMVGDRASDVEAGKENGLFVVGCDYAAFHEDGELQGADVVIHAFSELLGLVAAAEPAPGAP
ncbi:MTA/SAH nucleosidase [Alicyclobacillus cellulosilyticus]|uniref:MTA/SAH nucleosidase n=1 Tax=Alicyclobacillus cellulosilyticus TaxID=1003997 RepID=A0A917K3Y2_9BACL|nr:HAD-IA family hydrolase [Alicyclobacillus cellulosilyticus]GGI99906.1 MTA/SAH nucleosidase [Alicyclobacillus cellulosilyticus]